MLAGLVMLVAVATNDMPAALYDDFTAGRYGRMVQRVDSLLASPEGLTLPELALLHVWRGFGLAASGERQAARASFSVALSLDESLELDPREVSPKILAEFEAVRSSHKPQQEMAASAYLVMEDLRPGAALRSMMLPGWGQWKMGRKARGAMFAAAACASLGGWITAGVSENNTHDRYLAATGEDIPAAYAEYNRAYKVHRALGYAVLAVWAGAVADVLLGPSNIRIVASGPSVGVGATIR